MGAGDLAQPARPRHADELAPRAAPVRSSGSRRASSGSRARRRPCERDRMKKIGILGSGKVGEILGDGFLLHGYPVRRGTREPGKLAAWKAAAKGDASVGTVAETAAWADIVVLAVKGTAAEAVVADAGPANLAGKLVIDTTNPISDAPPRNGALQYFTGGNDSLIQRLQAQAPA